jgi:hypothetical protein
MEHAKTGKRIGPEGNILKINNSFSEASGLQERKM